MGCAPTAPTPPTTDVATVKNRRLLLSTDVLINLSLHSWINDRYARHNVSAVMLKTLSLKHMKNPHKTQGNNYY